MNTARNPRPTRSRVRCTLDLAAYAIEFDDAPFDDPEVVFDILTVNDGASGVAASSETELRLRVGGEGPSVASIGGAELALNAERPE